MDFDLLAVGGGFAGLTAAVRAAELGLRAAAIERGADALYMCNSRVATGALHVAFLGPEEPADTLFERMVEVTGGTARRDLARAFADNAARTIEWMRAHGASFASHPRRVSGVPIITPIREMRAGLDWEGSGPNRFLQSLAERLEAAGGRLIRGTAAVSLAMEGGRCVGVHVLGADGPGLIGARAVVLADGGFQASRELLGRHVTRQPERIRQRNVETGRGDGLVMAANAGAALVGLDKFYGHVLSRDAMTRPGLWPYPQLDLLCASSVVVDAAGRRFADEGQGGIALANAIAGLDDPLAATVVFDSAAWEAAKDEDIVPPNPALAEAGGTVLEAATVDALAAAAGLDRAGLARTIEAYNAAVASGGLGALAPPRSEQARKALPVARAPFRAVHLCAGITVTMGGVAVDGGARVLRADDTPIAGLYAAGSTAGGLEGGPEAGYVGGLIGAFLLGLLAAETAAREISAAGRARSARSRPTGG